MVDKSAFERYSQASPEEYARAQQEASWQRALRRGSVEVGREQYAYVKTEGGLEYYQSRSGQVVAKPVGKNIIYKQEDIERAQKETQEFLSKATALEVTPSGYAGMGGLEKRFFQEGGKWYTFEYIPETGKYEKVEVPAEKLQQEVFTKTLGLSAAKIEGYSIPDIGKIAEKQPEEFKFMGVEEAARQAKIKETFPELASQEYVNLADVQNVIMQRLEAYGWRPDTREKYETLKSLSEAVFSSPEAWNLVQADIDKQLAEFKIRQERLQRVYEHLGKIEDAVNLRDAELEAYREVYEPYAKAPGGFLEAMGAWAARSGWVSGFIANILGIKPEAPTGFETGYLRLTELEAKKERYTDPWSTFLAGLSDITLGLIPKPPKLGLSASEEKELRALEDLYLNKYLGRVAEYEVGAGAGRALGISIDVLAFKAGEIGAGWAWSKTAGFRQFVLETTGLDEYIQRAAEAIKPKLLGVGEKLGLIERAQYVPTEVDAVIAREMEPGGESFVAKTRFTEWGRAEEVLGKAVPESMRLKPGEVSMLPLEGGKAVPVVGEGEFGVLGGEKIAYTKGGLKLSEPLFVYGKGTGEESFIFARLTREQEGLVAPRFDIARIGGRVAYQKLLEQAMGGTPKAILYTEEMGEALGLSRTPKIPVLEKYAVTPLTWELPGKLPLYLHPPKIPAVEGIKPKVEPGKGFRIEPKIPTMGEFKPDVDVKPLPAAPKPVQFQPVTLKAGISPWIGDITAVAPRVSEVAAPRIEPKIGPRIEEITTPRIADVTVPRIAPKLEPKLDAPPVNAPSYPSPPRLPKLPPMPPLGFGGTRDVPVPRELRLYGRKEWLVRWFGEGAPEIVPPKHAYKRRSRRRGGRRR
jgi:hypothetical protein